MKVPFFAALVPTVLLALAAPVRAADAPLVIQVPPGKLDNGDPFHRPASFVGFSQGNKTVVVMASGYVGIFDMATGDRVLELDDHTGGKIGGWLSEDGSVLTTVESGKYSRRNPVTGGVTARDVQLPIGEVSPDGSLTAMPLPPGRFVPPIDPAAKVPSPQKAKPAPKPKAPDPRKDPEGYKQFQDDLRKQAQERKEKKKNPPPVVKPPADPAPFAPPQRSKAAHVLIGDAKTGKDLLALQCAAARPDNINRENQPKVVACKFAPDGARIAALLDDGSLNIWDLPAGGDPRVIDAGSGECEGPTPGSRGTLSWRGDGQSIVLSCGGSLTIVDVESGEATGVHLPNSGVLLPGEPAPARAPGTFPAPDMDGSGPKSDDAGEVGSNALMSPDGARVLQFRRLYPGDSAGGRIDHSSRIAVFDTSGEKAALLGRISGPAGEPVENAWFSTDSSLVAFAAARGEVFILDREQMDEAARSRAVLQPGAAGVGAGVGAGGTKKANGTGDLKVPNPLYQSWEGIQPGTLVEFARMQDMNGQKSEWTEVVLLEERDGSLGLTTRTFDKDKGPPKGEPGDVQPNLSRFDIPVRVAPSVASKGVAVAFGGDGFRRAGGKQSVKVGDRTFHCEVYERWPEDGGGVTQKTKYWVCADAPGFVVKYEDDIEGPGGKSRQTKVMSAITPK